jgi:hypothetical protein
MTKNWLTGTEEFSQEELEQFLKEYEQYGKHEWNSELILGDSVDPELERMANQFCSDMGRLQDRLALTLIALHKKTKPEKHSGDCSIYSSLINGNPEDGICTCGYGRQVMTDTGDQRELYSDELIEKIACVGGGDI